MRPTPAPVAAPLRPPISAPAAAPTAVPTAALFTPLDSDAPSGELPPTCALANWRHSASSNLNWSKLLPVPGRTITAGPVGIVVQAARTSTAPAAISGFFMAQPWGCGETRCQPAGQSRTYG